MEYQSVIYNLAEAPKDGKCWKMLIVKPNKEVVYEGDYTAKIGAERAAKRRLKRLNAGRGE